MIYLWNPYSATPQQVLEQSSKVESRCELTIVLKNPFTIQQLKLFMDFSGLVRQLASCERRTHVSVSLFDELEILVIFKMLSVI